MDRANRAAGDGNERTALYRLYDGSRRLLYVGITSQPDARWRQHADDKDWWPTVRSKKIEWFETRQEAAAAEKLAIKGELPVHNHTHGQSKLLAAFRKFPAWRLLEINSPPQRQVAHDIKRYMLRGEVDPGERLPTTQELADYYGVSRATVQKALLLLKDQGFAVGKPGSAVFAALPVQVRGERPHELGSREGDISLLGEELAVPSLVVLKAMGLPAGTELHCARWLRRHEGVPVEYVREYRTGRVDPDEHGVDLVMAILPPPEVIVAMDLPTDTSVLKILRTYHGEDGACRVAQQIFKHSDYTTVTYEY